MLVQLQERACLKPKPGYSLLPKARNQHESHRPVRRIFRTFLLSRLVLARHVARSQILIPYTGTNKANKSHIENNANNVSSIARPGALRHRSEVELVFRLVAHIEGKCCRDHLRHEKPQNTPNYSENFRGMSGGSGLATGTSIQIERVKPQNISEHSSLISKNCASGLQDADQ